MRKKIVIVEDEPDILEVLAYNLKREGFEVTTAIDGTSGLVLIQKQQPDLVLLDLMMPGLDGIELCTTLKTATETKNILVIMVTAKDAESDIVLGLGVGADDYISKPFSPRELVARVKAVLRRGNILDGEPESEKVEIGSLLIDLGSHKVKVDDREVKLTATEFRLLHFLASHPGRVYSREQILSHALGDDVVVVDRNIDVHIRGIRKKMDLDPPMIETIRGVGYCLRD